jgi:hypothetical protein
MLAYRKSYKIAIISYSTENVGDDIQSIALARLLPHVDLRFDRDDLTEATRVNDDVRFILNGWFAHKSHKVWPLNTTSKTLYIGFHATDAKTVPVGHYVGCRDTHTMALCESVNVKCWLSWCATLTLNEYRGVRADDILLVDVPESYVTRLPDFAARGRRITHRVAPRCDRLAEVDNRLSLYQSARLVITSRLHCMLPCLAMGTPVILCPKYPLDDRFMGYSHLAWSLDEMPWDDIRPKVSAQSVACLMRSFVDHLRRFINE